MQFQHAISKNKSSRRQNRNKDFLKTTDLVMAYNGSFAPATESKMKRKGLTKHLDDAQL